MAKESKHFKALREAVVARDLDAIAKVIDKVQADEHPYNIRGLSLLMLAVKMGSELSLIQLLVERGGARYDYQAPDGSSPLSYAQQEDRREVVEYFISRGAQAVYVPFAELPQATKDQRLADIIKDWTNDKLAARISAVIAGGANPNALLIDGKAALHYLAFHGVRAADAWQALLNGGGDPALLSDAGATPLHILSSGASNQPIAKLLLENVPLEIRDRNGRTPLHYAAASEYWDAPKYVQMLLDAGADTGARDNDGKSPGDLAKGETKKLLLAATSKPLSAATTALLTAISANDEAAVTSALAVGADPCAVDYSPTARGQHKNHQGIAGLHLMYARGVSQAIVDRVLASGTLNINVRAVDGQTPLHAMLAFAEKSPWRERLARLLALGADVNAADDHGRTALWQIQQLRSDAEAYELFQALVNAGANPALVDTSDETVFASVWERAQRFSEVQDKPGYVELLAKLAIALPNDRVTRHVKAWLTGKGATYLSAATASALAITAAAPAKIVRPPQFVAVTDDRLAALRGQATTLPMAGEPQAVALFDWFTLLQEEADDRHELVSELREYHISSDAEANVEAYTWVPFGIVGMNGNLDSYAEMGVAGTLYIELEAASGNDAPVFFDNQDSGELEEIGSFRQLIAQLATDEA